MLDGISRSVLLYTGSLERFGANLGLSKLTIDLSSLPATPSKETLQRLFVEAEEDFNSVSDAASAFVQHFCTLWPCRCRICSYDADTSCDVRRGSTKAVERSRHLKGKSKMKASICLSSRLVRTLLLTRNRTKLCTLSRGLTQTRKENNNEIL